MHIPIRNAAASGQVVRASRKVQKIRQDDAAGSIGVSENFLGKIEHGGETVQWGKLFQVLEGLANNDVVITAGVHKLKEGQKVRLAGEKN